MGYHVSSVTPKQVFSFNIYTSDLLHDPFFEHGDDVLRALLRQYVRFADPSDLSPLFVFGPVLHIIAEGFLKHNFFDAEG